MSDTPVTPEQVLQAILMSFQAGHAGAIVQVVRDIPDLMPHQLRAIMALQPDLQVVEKLRAAMMLKPLSNQGSEE